VLCVVYCVFVCMSVCMLLLLGCTVSSTEGLTATCAAAFVYVSLFMRVCLFVYDCVSTIVCSVCVCVYVVPC